jgi:Fe-S-cluster containining protein
MAWVCDKCGRCCKFWRIELNKKDLKRISDLGYKESSFSVKKKSKAFLRKRLVKCVFLSKKNECIIQKEHGYEYKPDICKSFPLIQDSNPLS